MNFFLCRLFPLVVLREQRYNNYCKPKNRNGDSMKKKQKVSRTERLAVALLSALFIVVAAVAVVKTVVRAPDPVTDDTPTPISTSPDSVELSPSGDADKPGETPANARREYCYNILVSGLDDDNGGSDTNILVNFDMPNQKITLVSLPRDTLLHHEWVSNKLNYAYAKGGTELLKSEIENLLGVPVDFYVTVNLKGFIALVDQIGGVDFEVPVNMDYDDPYQNLHIHYSAGMQHLNGQQAMEVVRWRKNNDGSGYATADIGRIGTQQAFLTAVAKQLLKIDNVPAMAKVFFKYVKTDLTTGNLVWLGTEALEMGMDSVSFRTLPGDGSGYYRKESVYAVDPEAALALVNEVLNPYEQPITAEDMDILVP